MKSHTPRSMAWVVSIYFLRSKNLRINENILISEDEENNASFNFMFLFSSISFHIQLNWAHQWSHFYSSKNIEAQSLYDHQYSHLSCWRKYLEIAVAEGPEMCLIKRCIMVGYYLDGHKLFMVKGLDGHSKSSWIVVLFFFTFKWDYASLFWCSSYDLPIVIYVFPSTVQSSCSSGVLETVSDPFLLRKVHGIQKKVGLHHRRICSAYHLF